MSNCQSGVKPSWPYNGGMLRETWEASTTNAMDANCACVYDHSDDEETDTDTLVDILNELMEFKTFQSSHT